MPELHIITGSNGAGKSSVGPIYLPPFIRDHHTVFDGDKLFMQQQGRLWKEGLRAHKEIKKIAFAHVEETFERLVETALERDNDFVYEGHFTNDATWNIPHRFKKRGYTIYLYFLGLSNPGLSDLRVIDRAKEGGHYVSPTTVRDNFYGNLEKLNQHYEVIDHLKILDTSDIDHILLAHYTGKVLTGAVPYRSLPSWFLTHLPALAEIIYKTQGIKGKG